LQYVRLSEFSVGEIAILDLVSSPVTATRAVTPKAADATEKKYYPYLVTLLVISN